jgi:hypothetical protein
MGGAIEGSYDLNGKVAIQYMINVGSGVIGRFEGLDKIEKSPFVIDVQQRHFVGDELENTGDIHHRAGEISVMIDRNMRQFKEAVQFIQNTLHIENEFGKNQIISPLDLKLMEKNYESWGKEQ